MRAQAAIFGGVYFEDLPRDAAVTNVGMQHGDVLVLATDGVFDNLNNQDILKIVTGRMVLTGAWTGNPQGSIGVSSRLNELTQPGGLDSSSSPPSSPSSSSSSGSTGSRGHLTLQALLAASIVGEAKLASVDMRRDGPFAKEAQRYYPGDWYRGGKVDDICAVVIMAVEE
jgi:protein phosphatase PTC7